MRTASLPSVKAEMACERNIVTKKLYRNMNHEKLNYEEMFK